MVGRKSHRATAARPRAARPARRRPAGPSGPPLLSLVLVPVAVTLGVTLLRLAGELMEWSPRLFSRVAGGGLAVVGIAWLVPILGFYFGYRLGRARVSPSSPVRAAGLPVAALDLLAAVLSQLFVVGGPAIGHWAAKIARGRGEIGESVGKKLAEIANAFLELFFLQQWKPVLGHEQAPRLEATLAA